ncbi:MAG TPA: response regulator [Planctomycetota bacterium]|nr:response regulator [Planctomycetota bacterium]
MDYKDRVRILIVDDKPDKAKSLGTIVDELGDVVCVHSGRDALRCLMNQSFAVILLDVNMPVMDGFETAEMIRKRETSERTPIIFITSYYDADTHRQRAYTLGAVDYILAPVIPEILRAKVSVFVDLFRKSEEVKLRADERVQLMQEQMARVAAEAARSAAEDGERRAAFLSNASQLLSSSFEYEDRVKRVAQLTVPELCDWCTVNIVKEDGSLQCLAVAPMPEGADMSQVGTPYAASDPVFKVIRTGVSMLIHDVAEDETGAVAALEQRLGKLGMPRVRSYMIVPLRARERTLGALKFIITESGRHLTHRDLTLGEDLGRRAAVAIDNARLYKEAQLANRMKDDFLAVLSHELRTPLTPILGWTRMLQDNNMEAKERKHAIDIIERNAKTQAKLIEDLLDVSRIITGKLRLNIAPVNLGALISASIESLRPAAAAKRIKVAPNVSSENMILPGDAERLQQVLWNLLSNAIKFTPEEGCIGVHAFRSGGKIVVEVSDTGRGIDSKFLPFVFDRFRQADSSTTRAYGGLGIGLAIVRHLVELHGGTVHADSPGPEKGSTFTVTLPVFERRGTDVLKVDKTGGAGDDTSRDPKEAGDGDDTTAAQNGNLAADDKLKGLTILVVDDEPDTRDLLSKLFERRGAQVVAAASAHEALQQLERGNPDLMISDIGMADEDGYGLMRKIRGNPGPNAKIPAIALTAYAREEDSSAALAAGFQVHLPKPIDPETLILSAEGLMLAAVDVK